jgi:NADP-dependent 3-hydroxy acid dehydrogenase YdfG
MALDARDQESVARFVAEAVAAFGKVDVLLNNAGCNVRQAAVETSWDDWSQVVDTKLPTPAATSPDRRCSWTRRRATTPPLSSH